MNKILCILILFAFFTPNSNALERVEITRTDKDGQKQHRKTLFVDLPDDVDIFEAAGEMCDPNKANACESPLSVCMWVQEDLQYRCSSRKKKRTAYRGGNNRRGDRHKHLHTDDNTQEHPHGPPASSDPKHGQQMGDAIIASGRSIQVSAPSGPISTIHLGKHSPRNGIHQAATNSSADNSPGNKTMEVPEYSGTLRWDGEDDGPICVMKHVMAEKMQEPRTMADKLEWINSNTDNICDFKRFFHCTIEPPAEDDEEGKKEFNDPETKFGVCRCYESSMSVVESTCYIPAKFGAKSQCGSDVVAPYPVLPWKGAPTLRPTCTPNSECTSSQFWFGQRCDCLPEFVYDKITHTCNSGIRAGSSLIVVVPSFVSILALWRVKLNIAT